MDDKSKYITQLEDNIAKLQKKVSVAATATSFQASEEGQLIVQLISERITKLVAELTKGDPLTDRDYLAHHGAIKFGQDLLTDIQVAATPPESAPQQLEVAKAQLDAIKKS